MKNGVIAITLLTLILLCAGQSYGLVMGPARFEVTLPPGEIAVADYYVQNDTEQDAHIVVEPENWYKDSYDYGKLDIKDWIEFDSYEFDLKPKEIKKLQLKIKVPKKAKGQLVAQIFFTSSVLREGAQTTEDGIKARVGSVLYVAIKGTEIVKAAISKITIVKEPVQGKECLKIEIGIKNNGNTHIRPTGKAIIEDAYGSQIKELDIISSSPALPSQEVVYNAIWSEPVLQTGKYNLKIVVNYGEEVKIKKSVKAEKAFEVDKDGKVVML